MGMTKHLVNKELTYTIDFLKLKDLHYFKKDPKRRSYVDIERMTSSITANGFISPILYWRSESGLLYVVDGICRTLALLIMLDRGEWPSSPFGGKKGMVPSLELRVEKKQIKNIILSLHSSFSVMTEQNIRSFVGNDKEICLSDYAFPEGTLIDFYQENMDISPYLTSIERVTKTNEKVGGLLK